MSDQAQWFDSLGTCCGCGKKATGKLMSTDNLKMGSYCKPCAEKRIKAAKAAREKDRAERKRNEDEPLW